MMKVEATLESVATGLNYLGEGIESLRDEFHEAREAAQDKREEAAQRISELEARHAAQIAKLEAKVENLNKFLWWAMGLGGIAMVGLVVEGAFLIIKFLPAS